MNKLTLAEIAKFRSELGNNTQALEALDTLEDCDGDLEDAAISLAIHVGQQPDRTEWLEGLAKRCRVVICQPEFREDLLEGKIGAMVKHLASTKLCPPILTTLVVLYVVTNGVDDFCYPLELKL